MRKISIIIGLIIVLASAAFIVFQQEWWNPRKSARELLRKSELILDDESREGIYRAIDNLSTLLARFPESEEARKATYLLAEAYEKIGLKDVALAKYRSLKETVTDPELRDKVRFRISRLQIMKNYSDEGYHGLMGLLSQTDDPEFRSEIYAEIGKYYNHYGKSEDAKRNFEIALREDADNREARLRLAEILNYRGQEHEAAETYEHYLAFDSKLATDPERAATLQKYRDEALQRGKTALNLGRYDHARHMFKLVLDRFAGTDAEDEAAYYTGLSYLKTGDHTNAIRFLNQAVSNKPRNMDQDAFLKKGEAHFHKKNYANAAAVFARLQELYPNGRLSRVAADWEAEARRAMQEQKGYTAEMEAADKVEPKPSKEQWQNDSGVTEETEPVKAEPKRKLVIESEKDFDSGSDDGLIGP